MNLMLMKFLVISVCLFACESRILFAELERKRTHAFEIRCYRRLLTISHNDNVTNTKFRSKIKAAFGEYDAYRRNRRPNVACSNDVTLALLVNDR